MTTTLDLTALKRLLDVIGGDPEDFEELRAEYIETAPEMVMQMKSAAASGDLDGLRLSAHSLKGNARDFGAATLAELCSALEAACKAGDVPDPAAAVAAIEAAEADARGALTALEIDDIG